MDSTTKARLITLARDGAVSYRAARHDHMGDRGQPERVLRGG